MSATMSLRGVTSLVRKSLCFDSHSAGFSPKTFSTITKCYSISKADYIVFRNSVNPKVNNFVPISRTFFPTHQLQKQQYRHFTRKCRNSNAVCWITTSSLSESNVYTFCSVRSMAGHAKWQNVKHVKAEKDAARSKMVSKFCRLVRYAVRDNGPDPKMNATLRNILDDARKNSIPMSTLESAMKKPVNSKLKTGSAEIPGPGGCLLVLEYETENVSTTRHAIKIILRKYETNIMAGEGRWRAIYEQKGIIKVSGDKEGKPLDAEAALDSAIEAGAEEVQLLTDEEDETKKYLQFFCDPNDVHQVKKGLMEMNYLVEEAYVGYKPMTFVQLSEQDKKSAGNLLFELDCLPEVTYIYENIK